MRRALIHRVGDVATALWSIANGAKRPPQNQRSDTAPIGARQKIAAMLDHALQHTGRRSHRTGGAVLEIDGFQHMDVLLPPEDVATIVAVTQERMCGALRQPDCAAYLGAGQYAVALSPMRRLDLEAAMKLSVRIQQALSDPIVLSDRNAPITASVGFALADQLDTPTGKSIMRAARMAQLEAQRDGPNAIRAYSHAMARRVWSRHDLLPSVAQALENGEIQAFFQPQANLETQQITGFEALVRWDHPTRGLISPTEFLPVVDQAGLMPRLGKVVTRDALVAIVRWDQAGLLVPQVSVNMSKAELRDPHLSDHIAMELDRFNLTPARLVIEVLETVVATRSDDMIVKNLGLLAQLGCSIDLDDFGTGHAAITSIRKFAINRIKIDRSFVTGIDSDREKQRMFSAIQVMAERLGLQTLAEGVETSDEYAQLARMGCGDIQGFALSRPLPVDETISWVNDYQKQLIVPAHLRRVR